MDRSAKPIKIVFFFEWPCLCAVEHVRAPSTPTTPLCRGTSLIRNSYPPQIHHRALGIVLLKSPREGGVVIGEVPL